MDGQTDRIALAVQCAWRAMRTRCKNEMSLAMLIVAALEALRNALFKCSTYLLTYL